MPCQEVNSPIGLCQFLHSTVVGAVRSPEGQSPLLGTTQPSSHCSTSEHGSLVVIQTQSEGINLPRSVSPSILSTKNQFDQQTNDLTRMADLMATFRVKRTCLILNLIRDENIDNYSKRLSIIRFVHTKPSYNCFSINEVIAGPIIDLLLFEKKPLNHLIGR